MFYSLFTLLILTSSSLALSKLPSYLKPCKIASQDLNKCAKEQTILAIPEIVKGDPKLGVPVLDPYHLDKIELVPSAGLKTTFTDVDIIGLHAAQALMVDIKPAEESSTVHIFFEKLVLKGNYEIDGQLMFLPIKGNGKANLTLENATFSSQVVWETYSKENSEYFKVKSLEVKYDIPRMYSHMENLFGGNKELGENMNQFLNDHWREYSKEIEPEITKLLSTIISTIVNAFCENFPRDVIFDLTE